MGRGYIIFIHFQSTSRNCSFYIVQRAVVLKMLHTQFKEFATNTRTLEILDEGKSADVDVALRAKSKTHAAEKHLH